MNRLELMIGPTLTPYQSERLAFYLDRVPDDATIRIAQIEGGAIFVGPVDGPDDDVVKIPAEAPDG